LSARQPTSRKAPEISVSAKTNAFKGEQQESAAALFPAKKRKRGAGSSRRRARGGVEQKQRKAGVTDKHDDRIRAQVAREGEVVSSSHFSIQLHASRTNTGWQGKPPPRLTQKEIIQLYETGEIKAFLSTFYPIYFLTEPE
jgi:hypothetical protein